MEGLSRTRLGCGQESGSLVTLHKECRAEQLWEAVSFATLGVCGAVGTVLALLRMAAIH
jgi:hypothetical protein